MTRRWIARVRGDQHGQVLVLVALSMVALLGAAGLAMDTGSTWAQKRDQQRGADLSATAGAIAEANGESRGEIIAAAVAAAMANGYGPAEVTVNIPPTQGRYGPGGSDYSPNDCSTAASRPCWIEVTISREHGNTFAGVLGLPSWPVSARAVAVGGIANTVRTGIAPIMFDSSAITNTPNNPIYCNIQQQHCPSNSGGPVPDQPNQYAWTTFCLSGQTNNCNVNSAQASGIIQGGVYTIPVYIGMDLGPNNQGAHTDLCLDLLATYPTPTDIPVAISSPTDNGQNAQLVGFWIFRFDPATTDCTGPGAPKIGGNFIEDVTATLPLTISPGAPAATSGLSIARLVE